MAKLTNLNNMVREKTHELYNNKDINLSLDECEDIVTGIILGYQEVIMKDREIS